MLRIVLMTAPAEIQGFMDAALQALRRQDTSHALSVLEEARRQKITVKSLSYIYALALLQAGRVAEATEALKEELLHFPEDPDASMLIRFLAEEDRRNHESLPAEQIKESPVRSPGILPVHFFTIVLNGMPFIRHHIEVFRKLPVPWVWHIVEGVAELKHDTAWSVQHGGSVTSALHREGRSNDGTTEYLDELKRGFPDQVIIYRKPPGIFWDGKLEMVSAPLENIREECLLWEIDSDELWSCGQIERAHSLFMAHPEKTAAYYFCHYYVGPGLLVTSKDTYGNNSGYEWLRTWRVRPGVFWKSHEPPCLCGKTPDGIVEDLGKKNPFLHGETESAGLVFQHYAYATAAQLAFKEIYYGYRNAVESWRKLNALEEFPALLRNYFPWVTDNALVNTCRFLNVKPAARLNMIGEWTFFPDEAPPDTPDEVVWVRPDSIGDTVIAMSQLPHIRKKYPRSSITVMCQPHLLELYEACPEVNRVITFEQEKALYNQSYLNGLIARLKALSPDIAMCSVYSPSLLHHLLVLATGAKQKLTIKGDFTNISKEEEESTGVLRHYTRIFPVRDELSELEHHKDFLSGLGIKVDNLQPLIWTLPEDEEFADGIYREAGFEPSRTVVVFSGAQFSHRTSNIFGPALRPVCASRGYNILAIGTGTDRALNEENCVSSGARYVNLSGTTSIRQCASILKRCRIAVGTETSHAHIAAAAGVPHVIMIGGGHFGRFMPYSPLTSLVCIPLDCFGCNWSCRFPSQYCMRDIEPSAFSEAVRRTLDEPSSTPRIFCQRRGNSGLPPFYGGVSSLNAFLKGIEAQIIELKE